MSLDDLTDDITLGFLSIFGPWSEHMEQLEWTLPGPLTMLRARNSTGSISVRGIDPAEEISAVRVSALVTVRGPIIGLAEAFAERVRVHVTQHGEAAYIQAMYPEPPLGCSVFVHYAIEVPREIDLDLATHNGGIVVSAIEGAVEAESWHGNIKVTEGLGSVILRTSNGDIRAADIEGALDLESGNGMITVCDIDGRAQLRTTRGRIAIEGLSGTVHAGIQVGDIEVLQSSGGIELETRWGDIRAEGIQLSAPGTFVAQRGSVNLALQATAAPVDVESIQGAVRLDLGPEVSGCLDAGTDQGEILCTTSLQDEERSYNILRGRLNGGSEPVIRLRTFDGDIAVHTLQDHSK